MATVASVTDLTQWVADRLEENTWSIGFSVHRYYLPYIALESITGPMVSVFIPSLTSEPTPRTKTTEDVGVAIRVYARMTPTGLAAQDKYAKLLEEIRDYFRHQNTTQPSGCEYYRASQINLIDPDDLIERNLYAGQVILDYKCRRDTGA